MFHSDWEQIGVLVGYKPELEAAYNKIDKQQGPTVEHRELHSISCKNL